MNQPKSLFRLPCFCTVALVLGAAGCATHRDMATRSPARTEPPSTAAESARGAQATASVPAARPDGTKAAVAAKADELRQASRAGRAGTHRDAAVDGRDAPRVASTPRKKSDPPSSSASTTAPRHAARHPSRDILPVEHVEAVAAGEPTERTPSAALPDVDPVPDETRPGVIPAADDTPIRPRLDAPNREAETPPVDVGAVGGGPDASSVEPRPADAPPAEPGAAATPDRPRLSDRLKIPEELPGAAVPPLRLPRYNLDDAAARDAAIEGLFPELPKEGLVPPGEQPPMKLEDFEQLALANNPKVAQASAEVTTANGQAIQAGLYPNPTVGYEADTVGSGGTANYHGVYVEQTIVTANKLGLARASAMFNIYNAQLKLQRTRIEVLSDVRSAYYELLTARETVRIYEALVRFTDQAYRVQVEQLKGGQAAAYEPMQLRAQSRIARTALIQARNRYDAAGRQLAAAVSMPEMRPAELDDVADAAVPEIDYDLAVSYMLTVHPDLGAANNTTLQAQTNVERARVVPIPNLGVYSAIQRDYTDPTHHRNTWNLQVGVPIPIFDRNQGAIQAAQGDYVRASYERTRVRNELVKSLADAFRRYENANTLVETYRNEIIPDQSRVYRAVYERHQQEPDVVGFGDIVVAQQTLQQSITAYAEALGQRWAALVEIQQLLQIEDGTQLVPLLSEPLPASEDEVPVPAPAP